MNPRTETTQDRILREFHQLLAQQEKLASRITTKEETAAKEKDKEIVHTASSLSVESIVKSLADLQLAFSRTVESLADTLVGEASKLEQVRRAIEVETEHLQELEHIEITANALDILIQRKREQAQTFEEQCAQKRQALALEAAAQREIWQVEKAEHERAVAEYEASLRQQRSEAEADFAYDLARKHKMEADKHEEKRRKQEQQIAETDAQKHKEWQEREGTLDALQEQAQEWKARIQAFSQELEEAARKAKEEAMQAASEDAQVKTDLLEKEIGANQQVRELKIHTLESTVAGQAEQIVALSTALKEARGRAQDLASKAVSTTAAEMPIAEQAKD